MDGWMGGSMDGWADGWMEGWKGWISGWIHAWMDGWMGPRVGLDASPSRISHCRIFLYPPPIPLNGVFRLHKDRDAS